MKEFEFCTIEDSIGEAKTKKLIIPTALPTSEIAYIDVSNFTLEQREQVLSAAKQYDEYVKTYQSTMFSFTDYMSHIGCSASLLPVDVEITSSDLIDEIQSN